MSSYRRTVTEHRHALLDAVRPLPPRLVPLTDAFGLVLAADVSAQVAVPPFSNSAMDGYLVRAADVTGASPQSPVTLTVVGDQPAGGHTAPVPGPGEAVRIMTGAMVPGLDAALAGAAGAIVSADSVAAAGASATPAADLADLAVVPVEHTDQEVTPAAVLPAQVAIHRVTSPGKHIRPAGEDVTPGAPVLPAGTLLGARDLSALASVGLGEVPVHPRVRVGVVVTGDELVDAGAPLGPGQIPDSNSILVDGLIRAAGCEPVTLPRSSDRPESLRAVLEGARGQVDAIVTTGGVSAGAYDVVKEVLSPLGQVEFLTVAMQPGKPQGFGVLDGDGGTERDGGSEGTVGIPIFCLPGNPVSVFVSFQVFVAPALARMGARFDVPADPPTTTLEVQDEWSSPDGREQYVPVAVVRDEADPSRVVVRRATAGGSRSHLIASLCRADALAIVPAQATEVRRGDRMQVMMAP